MESLYAAMHTTASGETLIRTMSKLIESMFVFRVMVLGREYVVVWAKMDEGTFRAGPR